MAKKRPTNNECTYPDRPCPHCGEWPDRHIAGYCLPCHAAKIARYRRRKRSACLSRWYADLATADAERAAMLASAIVDELGGYDRAARQLVAWLRESVASGKAPKASLRAIEGLVKMIQLSCPAEVSAQKKPTRKG